MQILNILWAWYQNHHSPSGHSGPKDNFRASNPWRTKLIYRRTDLWLHPWPLITTLCGIATSKYSSEEKYCGSMSHSKEKSQQIEHHWKYSCKRRIWPCHTYSWPLTQPVRDVSNITGPKQSLREARINIKEIIRGCYRWHAYKVSINVD